MYEDHSIMKIMHGANGDCQAVYKSGVKMVNLYDTAIAHAVIEYQNFGRSLSGNRVGFNNICELYGVSENPMKQHIHGYVWVNKENVFLQPKNMPLPEDIILYSACDVEPLLDLQQITTSLIEPDFQALLKDLCEDILIRQIDPELHKIRM